MNKRISGFDFARGLAIIGMIFINFKIVMSKDTDTWLFNLAGMLTGKAAALFIVLAGMGMTLMYNGAKRKNNPKMVSKVKTDLLKRAVFLFVIGLSYYFIWPADILHYYGLYLSIGIAFIALPRKWLIMSSLVLIIGYSLAFPFISYETGWDWDTLSYTGFFTPKGFIRNLFINGFHPVIPWIAFLITGIWVGRISFTDPKIRKKVTYLSIGTYIVFKGISILIVDKLSALSPSDTTEIYYMFGTSPMPPLFFYMVTASSLAIFLISISVYISDKYANSLIVKQIINTGQLALSIYFFHVIFGMLGVFLLFGKLQKAFSIEFVMAYACLFNFIIVVFSHYWKSKFKRGPLEYLMRKITG